MSTQPARTRLSPLSPLPAEQFGPAEAWHLLWRAGFGGTAEQIAALTRLGTEGAVDLLLSGSPMLGEPDRPIAVRSDIFRPPTRLELAALRRARQTQDEDALARLREQRYERERDDRSQMRQIRRWWLQRMLTTQHPLRERMTLFWHGHFATSYRKVQDSYHMYLQNELFRREALGSFETLLRSIIRDPAMLVYLDNTSSHRGRPNENLARELMELFSLGEGQYTEQDIREGARALTGYTIDDDQFVFRHRMHDSGVKQVLGRRGALDGDDFVSAILDQPACSRFIVGKLYRHFVGDVDPRAVPGGPELIEQLARLFVARGYRIEPVLRALLTSAHFYGPAVRLQRIKSPVQLVVGAARSLRLPPRDPDLLLAALELMGQDLFFPPSVRGWTEGRSWITTSTLFVRQNILVYLLLGRRAAQMYQDDDGPRVDPESLQQALGLAETERADPARVVEQLVTITLGAPRPDVGSVLLRYIADHGGRVTPLTLLGLLLLITATPEYQLC